MRTYPLVAVRHRRVLNGGQTPAASSEKRSLSQGGEWRWHSRIYVHVGMTTGTPGDLAACVSVNQRSYSENWREKTIVLAPMVESQLLFLICYLVCCRYVMSGCCS